MLLSLPNPLQDLWSDYRRVEGQSFSPAVRDALDSFIDALLKAPVNVQQPWALSLAAEFVDRGGYQVRDLLYQRAIFPALLNGLSDGVPGCARWLGGMVQFLYRCQECMQRLGAELSSEQALFRRALADDSADTIARKGLIKAMAGQFAYSLHELPSGVLFGHNGATPSECGQLRSGLQEFEALLAADGSTAAHEALIEKCRFHFSAYEQYLASRTQWKSYAAFIAVSGGGPGGG